MEFNSFGPAVGRLGSDSSRGGGKVEAGGLSPPPSPLTLTTAVTVTAKFLTHAKIKIYGIVAYIFLPSVL